MNQSRKRLTQLGISSFLIYPATIKVTHRGSTSLLQTPTDVEVYIDQQQELATLSHWETARWRNVNRCQRLISRRRFAD
ncbi:hypothetical protein QQF64_034386 [Cirrhinus molitorella]|uniref:Uncharacterized protein n=1 Tax=Cirrhinus molitorella TaxID=172907 RepID=A0ABR3L1G3_9TELE